MTAAAPSPDNLIEIRNIQALAPGGLSGIVDGTSGKIHASNLIACPGKFFSINAGAAADIKKLWIIRRRYKTAEPCR